MTQGLRDGLRMSAGSIISFAGLAVGLILSYGAWSRSDGSNVAQLNVLQNEVAALRKEKEDKAQAIAVLVTRVDGLSRDNEVLRNKSDEWKAYTYSLAMKMVQAGVRDLPAPPK